jgi:hypothetical protein
VLGLNAKLNRGKFNNGNGTLELLISGTASSKGTAKFKIDLVGKSCELNLFVADTLFNLPTNGLIGWWPFNGDASDESGNGNLGTILGGTNLTTNRFNNSNSAFEIDGINCPNPKGISIPTSINNAFSYSISVWFQSTDSSKITQCLFNSYPHQYIGISHHYFSMNKTSAFLGNGNWTSIAEINWSTFNLFKWHHIVVVKTTNDFKFYQDGILVSTKVINQSFNTGGFSNLNIGAISINGGSNCYETFKGKIDDIGVWNRALTQQEIIELYNLK